jgi:hypothetical protein
VPSLYAPFFMSQRRHLSRYIRDAAALSFFFPAGPLTAALPPW